jgi:hypothetical protein
VKHTRHGATAHDCFQLRQIADAGHPNGDDSMAPIADPDGGFVVSRS